jgi:predicted lysophospholipase L1 biosynthesis ABC-type transport system permease subunit
MPGETMPVFLGFVSITWRRRHDVAVLRVLGVVGGQVRSTLWCQARAVAAVGVVIGVPAGAIAGCQIWSALAEDVGVVGDWSIPWLAVVLAAARVLPGRRPASGVRVA